MNHRSWFRLILILVLIALTACSNTPPRAFAPDGAIIKMAIAKQLAQSQQTLTEQLQGSHPELDISKITVTQLDPLYLGNLPTYHLQGNYNLTLTFPEQKVTQEQNKFDVYVQRQVDGIAWRLIKREASQPDQPPQWLSYSLN